MNLFKTTLLATSVIALCALSPANAGSDFADFDVTLTIQGSCDVISADTVAFGNVLASAGTATADGDVTVQCTKGTAYALALNGGDYSSDNINARKMQIVGGGTDTIGYQLYQDSSTSTVWGENAGTDTVDGTGAGYGTAFSQVHTVYAEATIAGTETVGNYKDTVTATVTF